MGLGQFGQFDHNNRKITTTKDHNNWHPLYFNFEAKKNFNVECFVYTGESSTGCYPCQWLHNPGGV